VVQTQYAKLEIIVADNASSDGSVEFVEEHYPHVRIVRFPENYRYCKGNNLAATHASGDIVVFLNNDVRVEPDWLDSVTDLFDEFPKLAAVQPKLLSDRKPEYFEYAGAAGGQLDKLGYPWCRGRIFETVEKDNGQYDAYPNRIFWASGAAFCVKKDLFLKAGGFDEDFELHMEEIDLCWRLQRMKYEIRFAPKSVVYHLGGGSLQQGNPDKHYYNFRNNLAMVAKNCPSGQLVVVLFLRVLLDALAGLRFFFSGDIAAHKAVWRAYRDFCSRLPYWLTKRGELEAKHPSNINLQGYGPFSIAWDYYIKGRRRANSMPFSIVLLTFFSATRSDRGGKKL